MDMIWTRLRFDNLYTFLLTQFSQYYSDILLNLSVNRHSPILWRKHNMVLTTPRRML